MRTIKARFNNSERSFINKKAKVIFNKDGLHREDKAMQALITVDKHLKRFVLEVLIGDTEGMTVWFPFSIEKRNR